MELRNPSSHVLNYDTVISRQLLSESDLADAAAKIQKFRAAQKATGQPPVDKSTDTISDTEP